MLLMFFLYFFFIKKSVHFVQLLSFLKNSFYIKNLIIISHVHILKYFLREKKEPTIFF
jgi:hypothetical protein